MTVHTGDALQVLRTLPAASVQTCVTSPPYWGLRDYGVAGQIGVEETPGEYIDRLVDVFREVRRVISDDGTLWVNLGDSYCSTAPGTMGDPLRRRGIFAGVQENTANARRKMRPATPAGMKPKDLVGIPWLVALALRDDGWYLRADIIWAKRNVMPESVKDRPTRAHEYLFLLAKSERYFYDAAAIAEPSITGDHPRNGSGTDESALHAPGQARQVGISRVRVHGNDGGTKPGEPRNRRSVWTISTQPFPEAHFATFPEELPRLCILAGSRPGDTVLDPFTGAGTTGLMADAHQRKFIGIELNPEYAEMARRRIARDGAPLFSTGAA